MPLAPIILFVYNRPHHTQKVIDSLLSNPLAQESELYIYSDAPKDESVQEKVSEVRTYIHSISGFKNITIIEREKNLGLAQNIIDGVSTIIDQYDRAIILEDDLLLSPYFLDYMNTTLNLYEHDEQVACITAFNFPLIYPPEFKESTFFIKGADCWTWATWKRAWKKFEKNGNKLLSKIQDRQLQKEFDIDGSYPYTKMLQNQIKGKNDSWAIRWYASAFLENMLCLYPTYSLVENIGYDGTHFKSMKKSNIFGEISSIYIPPTRVEIQENTLARQTLCLFFKQQSSFMVKISKKLKRFFNETLP